MFLALENDIEDVMLVRRDGEPMNCNEDEFMNDDDEDNESEDVEPTYESEDKEASEEEEDDEVHLYISTLSEVRLFKAQSEYVDKVAATEGSIRTTCPATDSFIMDINSE
ncbi:hypothetical protein L6452_18185 [Arctium lappa]|uniref:Uncharacterized protein n=1 Tax=Arctium lappa TaxID=4217 RepID=A0ACB9C5M3_ARCLA|nr:hypothetical protein L6452_18185 [Arctium lappa]